jgi:hypothetical protein
MAPERGQWTDSTAAGGWPPRFAIIPLRPDARPRPARVTSPKSHETENALRLGRINQAQRDHHRPRVAQPRIAGRLDGWPFFPCPRVLRSAGEDRIRFASRRGYRAAVDDIPGAGDGTRPGRDEEGDEVRHFSRPRRAPDALQSETPRRWSRRVSFAPEAGSPALLQEHATGPLGAALPRRGSTVTSRAWGSAASAELSAIRRALPVDVPAHRPRTATRREPPQTDAPAHAPVTRSRPRGAPRRSLV